MESLIFELISFAITSFAFFRGVRAFFRKGKPMYFQLLVCAVGCYALQELFSVVNYLCGGYEGPITIGTLGTFGCFGFLFSANFGQLDGIVDDGSAANRRARVLAFLAPALLASAVAWTVVMAARTIGTVGAAVLAVIWLPALPAVYFNLKHLLLPIDDFGFLRATKLCNVSASVFCVLQLLHLALLFGGFAAASNWLVPLLSVSLLGIELSCERGMRLWGI